MKNCNKYNTTVYINKLLSVKINVGQHLPSWRNIDYKKSVSSSKKVRRWCIMYIILELSHDIILILGVLLSDILF